MTTLIVILNAVFATLVVGVIVAFHARAIVAEARQQGRPVTLRAFSGAPAVSAPASAVRRPDQPSIPPRAPRREQAVAGAR